MFILSDPITKILSYDRLVGKAILQCGESKYYFKVQYPRNYRKGDIIESNTRAFNEVFASVIGRYLGLPVPETKFIYQYHGKELFHGSVMRYLDNCKEWLSYIAEQMKREISVEEVIQYLANKDLLIYMYLFDRVIANNDRNFSNILVQQSSKKEYTFYLIDHDYSLFGMDDRLNIVDFINARFNLQEITRKYPRELLYFCRDNLSNEKTNHFLNLILNEDFVCYLKEIEPMVTCLGKEFVSTEEYEEAVKLIITRAKLVKEYNNYY